MTTPHFLRKPLTQEEIEERYKDVLEEWEEVNEWVKEESERLEKDNFKTHQARSAAKRNLIKAKKRVDSVRGTKEYWKNRIEGMTHFRASIILNEYWASLKEKAELDKKAKSEEELPEILKKKKK